jgi:hypothetical protein
MSRNFFEDLLDLQNLVYRFQSLFLGGSWKGPSSIKDKQAITPPPRPGTPAQGQGPQRPGAAQGQAPQRPGMPAPQRPGMSPQGQAPQRPGMPPQSPLPIQNQSQTPPTSAESLADQQMKLIKARGMNYFNNLVSTRVNQLYSNIKAYFERRS